MTSGTDPGAERLALDLTPRDWRVVGLLVALLIGIAPAIPFRPAEPKIELDYRIPYALSSRYDLYRRYTSLAADQFPSLIVGDSVVWGQCSRRDQTLSHHLNELTKQPRFANAGLDGMHPIALAELLEYHAPAIAKKRVLLQFDPLWLIVKNPSDKSRKNYLFNRPDLIPRLAARFKAPFKQAIAAAWSRLYSTGPLKDWTTRLADTRVDFLAWSLDHPYESPLKAISAALPPSEDSKYQVLVPWTRVENDLLRDFWGDPDTHPEWLAFERLIGLLESRDNKILVVLGPMNEHMMASVMRASYLSLRAKLAKRLEARGVATFTPSLLPSDTYADICHPLAPGYELMAKELLQRESAWLLGLDEKR